MLPKRSLAVVKVSQKSWSDPVAAPPPVEAETAIEGAALLAPPPLLLPPQPATPTATARTAKTMASRRRGVII
jgi:hypothetical protein